MKPNVLHLINSFEQGGTERQTLQLVRLLKEHGRFGVGLACLNAHGMLREEAEGFGLGEIREYRLGGFGSVSFARQVWRLARYLRERRVSVVHAHDLYTNIFGMFAATLARTPARIASRRDTEGFRTPAQSFVERRAYGLAQRVVVNAEAVREFLVRGGVPSGKIVTLYNGLDTRRVEPPEGFRREAALASLGLPEGRRFVTIVANVQHEVKDHRTFLRAARRVKGEVSDAAFVVAGEGRLLEPLRDYAAELGIGADVFFTGRCARVAELLAVSDVCVLSSKAEGFSNSILEYMAAARPVVATDVGGAREAVAEGETGHLVPPGDDELLGARVASLLKEPERARLFGERGRRVVAERFSCAAQLANAEALYESLLARRALEPAQEGVAGVPRTSG
ncbi:MAG TPA: glycosyltransferase [Pyrinomonadaceae bacterium]|nr:glycosyltransferase [Pyrinomonadaceae bacterium]